MGHHSRERFPVVRAGEDAQLPVRHDESSIRFSSEDKIERSDNWNSRKWKYLYDDGVYYYFMNAETFEAEFIW